LASDDPVGPLVLGGCLEREGKHSEALDLYADYIERDQDVAGVATVRARKSIAERDWARALAARAMEENRRQVPDSVLPPEASTLGVLPFVIDGDPEYQSLSLGLAHMLTADLALLRRFRLVERVRIDAVLRELAIPRDRVDPTTAVRTGRLLRASRLVLGTATVFSEAETELVGNIVLETGRMVGPSATRGEWRQILDLEKDLAIQTAAALGYQLTEAERQRIVENRPKSLMAFLAFCNGLLSEDQGDFRAAAASYHEALRLDPEYREAEERRDGAVGQHVLTVLGPWGLHAAASQIARGVQALSSPAGPLVGLSSPLASSVLDLASHQAERATLNVGTGDPSIDVVPKAALVPNLFPALMRITIVIPR
jgi:tetratricopeptide (TPR) repeat protein